MSDETEHATVNDEGGVVLSDEALRALAERLVARHVAHADWLQWEDHAPALAEGCFIALAEQVEWVGEQLLRLCLAHDAASGIDSGALLDIAATACVAIPREPKQ